MADETYRDKFLLKNCGKLTLPSRSLTPITINPIRITTDTTAILLEKILLSDSSLGKGLEWIE